MSFFRSPNDKKTYTVTIQTTVKITSYEDLRDDQINLIAKTCVYGRNGSVTLTDLDMPVKVEAVKE